MNVLILDRASKDNLEYILAVTDWKTKVSEWEAGFIANLDKKRNQVDTPGREITTSMKRSLDQTKGKLKAKENKDGDRR